MNIESDLFKISIVLLAYIIISFFLRKNILNKYKFLNKIDKFIKIIIIVIVTYIILRRISIDSLINEKLKADEILVFISTISSLVVWCLIFYLDVEKYTKSKQILLIYFFVYFFLHLNILYFNNYSLIFSNLSTLILITLTVKYFESIKYYKNYYGNELKKFIKVLSLLLVLYSVTIILSHFFLYFVLKKLDPISRDLSYRLKMKNIIANNYRSILIAPIYEEIAYRKIFYDATIKSRKKFNPFDEKKKTIEIIYIMFLITMNCFIFYFSHPIKGFSILIISIIFSLTYIISKKIEKSIILHGIYNTIVLLVSFLTQL